MSDKKEYEKNRWRDLQVILGKIPMRDEITAEFVVWAVDKGMCLDDPLKSDFTFSAAWAAWNAAQESLIHSEHMGRVAAWLDGGCKAPEPVRKAAL